MRIRLSISLLIIFCCCDLFALDNASAVRFGRLIDGHGKTWTNAVVLVRNGRVEKLLTSDAAIPADAKVIDLHQYTGVPGLIDVHTHMTFWSDPKAGTPPFEQYSKQRSAFLVYMAQENARKTLEAGVTTVRDLGSDHYDDIVMRDLINRGAMVGPRMFVAGCGLTVTSEPFKPEMQPQCGQADGVPEVLKAVREQVAAGVDVIKVYGSTGSDKDVSGYQTFTSDEMKAAVEAAHKFGRRVATHSYGPDGARDAVSAGTDSLEHAIDIPDDVLAEMVKRGTFYVPTIDHNRYYVDAREEFKYDDKIVAGLNAYIEKNLETARRAHKAGVKFAMGSDAVFSMFGQNTRELGWFVKAGMTPAEALQTATTNGAALLGMSGQLGAIAPGYFADLVAVEGDPLGDIKVVIDNVRWVMKDGQIVVDKRP
jgi:imidazolonepropionase-like amidohydrolase